jgi:hypothetical protein
MNKRSGCVAALTAMAMVWVSGCTDDATGVVGTGLVDDVSGSGTDGSALADGWQFDKDASAPDGWSWSDDASVWIGPDGASAVDAVAQDGTVLSDGTANPDAKSGQDATALPGELGGACKSIADCPKGTFCAAQGGPAPYCSTYGCANSGDCSAIPSSDPMCCLTYTTNGKTESYCLKQPGATQCGKQDKPVGADCSKGGQSDCGGEGNWCFETGGAAQCVQGCSAQNDPVCSLGTTCNIFQGGGGGCLPYTPGVADGSPCAGNALGGCGKYAFCIEGYKGDPLAYCATACTKDAECAAGLSCFLYDGVQGICQQNGTKDVGANCAGDRFSCAKGLYCVGFGTSAAVCSPSCAADVNCTALGKSIGGGAYCAKSPGNAAGVCYPKGVAGNGGTCADNPYQCAEGLYCIGGYDGYDPGAFCQKSCMDGAACPANSTCIQYTKDYSGCQPNGTLPQGGDCQGDPTQCKAGEFCLGAGKTWQCMTQCKLASPSCPGSTWCMPYGEDGLGVCWPTGTKAVGSACKDDPWSCQKGSLCSSYGVQKNASCLQNCDSAPCPSGFTCDDFGQSGHWCQPIGAGQQGATCSLGAPCVTGSVCVGQEGPAPFCSKQCAADSDCPATDVGGKKLWCAKGKWGGYCVPNGGIAKNGSCFQQPWACAKDLVCLGDSASNPGAFCAQACSGFASVCTAGEKCEYLGGGDAFCFKTGTLQAGETCLQEPLGCATDTLCIKGTPQPQCVQQCGVGYAACPKNSPCTSFIGSAVKLCVPKDFIPFGVITLPF